MCKIKFLIFTILIISEVGLSYAQTAESTLVCKSPKKEWFGNNGTFDIGYYSTTVKPVAMKDFDLSDYSIYGLKSTDPNSKESRFRVPIGNLFPSTFRMNGFYLGVRWNYHKKVQGGFSLRYAAGIHGSEMFQFGLIVSPQIYTFKRFKLVADFEIGDSENSFTVHNLSPMDGYHPYLRAHDAFDLKQGSNLYISNTNFYIQAGLNLQFALTSHTKTFANISLNRNINSGGSILIASKQDSESSYMYSDDVFVVSPEESSSKNTYVNANLVRTKMMFTFGFMFDISGYPTTPEKPVNKCSCCGQVIPQK